MVNVYDFDKTIYDGDSTLDFYFFEIKKYLFLIRYFPKQFFYVILYSLKLINKDKLKECFFCFIKGINNLEKEVELFWKFNKNKIKKWYLSQKLENDIVISASPEWLLKPIICDDLGLKLIATKVNPKTGYLESLNCYGEEKVKRFEKEMANVKIQNFYSDSISDISMARKSDNAWLVDKNKIEKWNFN